MYHQVHQELFAASETTENFEEIPVVLEQVIVQEISDVIVPLPPVGEFSAPVYHQVHQEPFAASEMTENIAEIPVVQVQENRSGGSASCTRASSVPGNACGGEYCTRA